MPSRADCSSSPSPLPLRIATPFAAPVAASPAAPPEPIGGRYTLDEARLVLWEMAAYMRYARDRIENTADRLPPSEQGSDDREAMRRFERPYDVPGEMEQVLREVVIGLEELIDRVEAASRVTEAELREEFPELREAAAAPARQAVGSI